MMYKIGTSGTAVVALLGEPMAVFVFVTTVLRSCLVDIHWQITHIWRSTRSCFVEIRWRIIVTLFAIHWNKTMAELDLH